MSTKGQGHSSNLVQVTQIQYFQTSFPSLYTRFIETKFHMEPPCDGGMKVYSSGPGHMTKMATFIIMPIYGKNL